MSPKNLTNTTEEEKIEGAGKGGIDKTVKDVKSYLMGKIKCTFVVRKLVI